ncbi:MAG: hypothetical protein DCC55_40255, partial [Chloroflexi bacterium]
MHQPLKELRCSLPVTERCIYLQTGSLGPLSRPTLQAIHDAEELAAREGPASPDGLTPLVQTADAARTALTRLLNAPPDTVCWSLNTSTAMRTVIQSLGLTGTDCLITSDQEHVATRSLYNGLCDALGLTVEVVSTAGDDGDFLERLEQSLRAGRRGRKIVLLSHVSCIDGRLLPVADAVALTRRYGGVSLIDGAQAVGQIPVDLGAIGADFYIGSCHKWLLGPGGVGYIHVRSERLTGFNPHWLPDADRAAPTAARLGEVGTTNLAQRAGVGAALAQIETVGMETVATHSRQVTQRLRDGLRQFRLVQVLGPDDPVRTTGLVGFTVHGWTADDCRALVERLYRQQRIL